MIKKGGKADNQLKVFVYGDPFSGKTHFASTFPKPLVLSTDGNAQYFEVDYIEIKNIEDYEKALDFFMNTEHEYETLVIDNLNQLFQFVRKYYLDKQGVIYEGDVNDHGKTWKMVRLGFLESLKPLNNITDKSWVVIDHMNTRVDSDQLGFETTYYEPKIDDTKENIHGEIMLMTTFTCRATTIGSKDKLEYKISLGHSGNELTGVRLPIKETLIDNNYEAFKENIK